ncbi:DUF3953 domain-containing protein [Niallia circulans]|uniref:DUF3953 domain-containing protein n=1 Tax=Niallia circulans TaxID=1397 RepID=A0A553SRT6_NIACI|nr:DUF3953 domain-containing protein [Niallia circulans]TRZ39681.1 DUF3953 domain-containing protein [Niallia circulans]
MFRLLKIILGFLAAILALFGTITDSTLIFSFMYFFLGLLLLVIGFSELKKIDNIAPILMLLLAGFFILGSFYIMFFET